MSEGLPRRWITSTIGECFLDIRNGTTTTQNKDGKGLPITRIETIQNNEFDLSRIRHIENIAPNAIKTFCYRKGDIAFSHINSYEHVGKTALYKGKPEIFIHGMNLLRLRLGHNQIEPRFAHLFMQTQFFREEVRQRVGHAVNQVSINQKNLAEVPFVIAPFNEQQRIVAKLEVLLDKVDACQKRLERIPALLKRFRQSVLTAACSGHLTADWRDENIIDEPAHNLLSKLSAERRRSSLLYKRRVTPATLDINGLHEIPDAWEWATLDQIVEEGRPIIYGIIKPGKHDPDGIPYVRVMEMKDGTIAPLSELRRASKDRANKFKRATLKSGDLLISKDGTIGRVAIVPPELEGGNITQHLVRVSVHQFLFREYIAYSIRSKRSQDWLIGEKKGVALQGVNVEDFRRLPIPIPPLSEQQEIVRRVEALFKFADRIEERYQKAEAYIDKLTQSILAKAFCGELVPQDPNDEPASELLRRIKGEREKTGQKPKIKRTQKKV